MVLLRISLSINSMLKNIFKKKEIECVVDLATAKKALCLDDASTPSAVSHMINNASKKKKVCVIDDDENIREIYRLKFDLEGYDVSVAVDGEDGLKVIREKTPDIILLDLQMPIKDGVAVLQELRGDAELSKIPVVILSNIDNEDAFREVGKFETRFYLIKSLTTPQKAVDIVREILH